MSNRKEDCELNDGELSGAVGGGIVGDVIKSVGAMLKKSDGAEQKTRPAPCCPMCKKSGGSYIYLYDGGNSLVCDWCGYNGPVGSGD